MAIPSSSYVGAQRVAVWGKWNFVHNEEYCDSWMVRLVVWLKQKNTRHVLDDSAIAVRISDLKYKMIYFKILIGILTIVLWVLT
jgi:hypothetical protein